jgi:hypothetical protein
VPVQAGRYCTADPRRHCLNNQPEKGNSLDPFKGVELWVLPKLMLCGSFIIMDQPMQHILRPVFYICVSKANQHANKYVRSWLRHLPFISRTSLPGA